MNTKAIAITLKHDIDNIYTLLKSTLSMIIPHSIVKMAPIITETLARLVRKWSSFIFYNK